MKIAVSALMLAAACLLALGVAMMASIQGHLASTGYNIPGTEAGLVWTQMIWIGLALVLMGVVSRVDYRHWRPLVTPFTGMVFMLLALALIPGMGPNYYGARRWLYLGPWGTFQPSALAGLAVVLFMAWWYSSVNPRSSNLFWVPVAVMFGLTTLVFIEPDYSVAVLILLTGWVMMILGKARYDHVVISIVLPVTGVAWGLFKDPFNGWRLMAFFKGYPEETARLPVFVMALMAGGWSGVGLGNGHWTGCFLPEAFDGLVAAAIGEELGLATLLIVMAMYGIMIVSGAYIAAKAPDRFGTLLGAGIVSLLAVQVLLNLVSATWLIPIKAVPLPLVSHAGHALCIALTGVGVLLSIAKTKTGATHEAQ